MNAEPPQLVEVYEGSPIPLIGTPRIIVEAIATRDGNFKSKWYLFMRSHATPKFELPYVEGLDAERSQIILEPLAENHLQQIDQYKNGVASLAGMALDFAKGHVLAKQYAKYAEVDYDPIVKDVVYVKHDIEQPVKHLAQAGVGKDVIDKLITHALSTRFIKVLNEAKYIEPIVAKRLPF